VFSDVAQTDNGVTNAFRRSHHFTPHTLRASSSKKILWFGSVWPNYSSRTGSEITGWGREVGHDVLEQYTEVKDACTVM
jgi:hypothetical protein